VDTPKTLSGTCDRNAPELDHIVPVSRGGLHTYENTQCLCRSCNGWKAARTMEEAVAALRVNP
jgi:5-methylcytosine-specific restriction endonuclease McrA